MKYLCIHGHFYQPPRENAWLEEIELQESARPYHDWNARICAECYSPNALARVLNGNKELTDLVNNYSHISFNFGPTLLSWMEAKEPEVYQAILEADRQSRTHFSGHGSAIAQCYNHMILPLANGHDKETQIKWGIYDFEKRFGRKPEALWLAETACNTETLEVLAANGMKFVILAPGQCARIRKIGDDKWQEIGGGVDPKRAYLCNLPSGLKITLFFYDGPISQGIAFSDTLSSGEKFASRLLSTYNNTQEAQLMHIATDGETYGHHQKFAEMALAYCLKTVQEKPDVQLTVYGEFLEKNPPQYEAQIRENTSWSCFHGVERWRADCGCNSGMHGGWNQKWRGPLRSALDFIRDEMIKTFENTGREYFKNVWAARNDYIELILDRSLDAQHKFFLRHATEKAWNDRSTALMLLEMQRMAMLMYTSCGWFFDEVSGLETTQIMQYACRAMELNRALSGHDLEPTFIKMLEQAPSNLPELKNGAVAYVRYVKPQAASLEKMALSHLVTLLADETTNPSKAYACDVLKYEPTKLTTSNMTLWYGHIALKSRITLEERNIPFALLRRGTASLTCAAGTDNTESVFAKLKELFEAQKYEECAVWIRQQFRQEVPLTDMFMDVRRKVVEQVLKRMNEATAQVCTELFEKQYPVVRGLQLLGTPIPRTFLTAAEFVLSNDLVAEFRAADVNVSDVEELMEDVKTLGLDVSQGQVARAVSDKLTFLAFAFARNPQDKAAAHKLVEFLNYIEIFGFSPDTVKAQEFVYFGLKALGEDAKKKDILRALARKLKIAL
ncbi:MAG: DUF3536 domain-containing protein [Elusimicrobiaceae bacterium]|nr:DUF3536 domain-containing protein [Elusimicrobiaceae bacterium]